MGNSEHEAQTELDVSRIRAGQDLAKLGRPDGHARAASQRKRGVVEDIENLRPELHVVTLSEGLVPDESHVEVLTPRVTQSGLRNRVVRHGIGRGLHESARVKPAVRTPLARREDRIAQAVAAADVQPEIQQASVVGRRNPERDSALYYRDAADLPIADDASQRTRLKVRPAFAERYLVHITQN